MYIDSNFSILLIKLIIECQMQKQNVVYEPLYENQALF